MKVVCQADPVANEAARIDMVAKAVDGPQARLFRVRPARRAPAVRQSTWFATAGPDGARRERYPGGHAGQLQLVRLLA
jgi:hypothetical protein